MKSLRLLVVLGALASPADAAGWPARGSARPPSRRAALGPRRALCPLMAASKQGKKKGGGGGGKVAEKRGFGADAGGAPGTGAARKPAAAEPAASGAFGPPPAGGGGLGSGAGVSAVVPELSEAQRRASEVRVNIVGDDPFMRIEPERWAALRLPRASSNEAVLQVRAARARSSRARAPRLTCASRLAPLAQGVLDAQAAGRLDAFVASNRDYVIKRYQLWMMAHSFRQAQAGDAAGSGATRAALSQLIVSNRNFDAPLAVAVDGREKALNAAFEASAQPEERKPTIVDLAGSGPLEQLGFWVVIASAKEAWLERLADTEAGDERLREAMGRKVGQMDQFLEAVQLTPEIQVEPVPTLLAAMRTNEVEVGAVSDRLVFQLGAILGCLECLRFAAFSALATRVASLMDVVASGAVRPMDLGGPLELGSEIDKARADGSLSMLIQYEQAQERANKGEVTIKLVRARARARVRHRAAGRARSHCASSRPSRALCVAAARAQRDLLGGIINTAEPRKGGGDRKMPDRPGAS